MPERTRPTRIWYQSFTDPIGQAAYFGRLRKYLGSIAGPGVTVDVHGISPPDHALHRLTEFRCAAQVVRNALAAQDQGYDAFVIGHFQDAGLYEARASVDLPVLGLGEASMLFACTLGRKIGMVTIDPIFIPMHEDQVARYALQGRVVKVAAIAVSVAGFMEAFENPRAYEEVKRQFEEQVGPLVAEGVEVIIPAGGLPTLLFLRERNYTIERAIVLNGIAVVETMAEQAVRLHRLDGTGASRASTFALPPPEAVKEFLAAPPA